MTRTATNKTRLLVAEDDGMVRRLLSAILEKQGHCVLQAENGIEALKLIDSEPVDAIVLDLLMPEMDGLKFLHELRQVRHMDTPVLVLTASLNPANGDEQRVFDAGANCVARKPVKAPELLKLLQQILGK
ncbi:MAG TPA: response regulator [Gammaproteobacteria bacterium]|nr:response regulator [Gammaproteobacteria bacterium]